MDNEQKPAIEFFKQEYMGISKAFGDLYNVILKVFNLYLFLTAVPFTVAAIIYKSADSIVDPWNLPFSISALLFLVSLLGLLTVFSMIHLRMEQILYAKTINCIRRFFWETELDSYLSLPITDELPPFLELWRAFFWQIIAIGVIDAVYIGIAFVNLTVLPFWLVCLLCTFFFLLHVGGYIWGAMIRENRYKVKCPQVTGRTENY
jgi:hypothetical protein